jgi:hypothetical protein
LSESKHLNKNIRKPLVVTIGTLKNTLWLYKTVQIQECPLVVGNSRDTRMAVRNSADTRKPFSCTK